MPERLVWSGIFGAALAVAACASAGTAPPDAAARGAALAQASCASCHAIAAEDASPHPDAPAFKALANRPDMSRTALAVLLRTPHRTMPNLIVAPDEVDDLAAYLATLRS